MRLWEVGRQLTCVKCELRTRLEAKQPSVMTFPAVGSHSKPSLESCAAPSTAPCTSALSSQRRPFWLSSLHQAFLAVSIKSLLA